MMFVGHALLCGYTELHKNGSPFSMFVCMRVFFSFDKTQKALSLDALTEGTVMCKPMEEPTPQNYNTTLMCYAPPGETSLDIP